MTNRVGAQHGTFLLPILNGEYTSTDSRSIVSHDRRHFIPKSHCLQLVQIYPFWRSGESNWWMFYVGIVNTLIWFTDYPYRPPLQTTYWPDQLAYYYHSITVPFCHPKAMSHWANFPELILQCRASSPWRNDTPPPPHLARPFLQGEEAHFTGYRLHSSPAHLTHGTLKGIHCMRGKLCCDTHIDSMSQIHTHPVCVHMGWQFAPGGRGGTHNIFEWGCAAWSWKPLPYFIPKYTIFHTLFQTL